MVAKKRKQALSMTAARYALGALRDDELDKINKQDFFSSKLWQAMQKSPRFESAKALYAEVCRELEVIRQRNNQYNLSIPDLYLNVSLETYVAQSTLSSQQMSTIRAQAENERYEAKRKTLTRFKYLELRLELAETTAEIRQVLTDAGYKFTEEKGEASHADGTTARS